MQIFWKIRQEQNVNSQYNVFEICLYKYDNTKFFGYLALEVLKIFHSFKNEVYEAFGML